MNDELPKSIFQTTCLVCDAESLLCLCRECLQEHLKKREDLTPEYKKLLMKKCGNGKNKEY